VQAENTDLEWKRELRAALCLRVYTAKFNMFIVLIKPLNSP